ncbi:hypothetical protein DH2020_017966 [Rehmannia glutinosa]|uniref:DUF7811 domain-containing protein n=1 Tax=Rehmannia glutinosa TaxID=99300 RepID=A0ABR0WJ06_REHGL
MAETTSALCFSTFSASIPFSKEPISSPSTSFTSRRFSSQSQRPRSRSLNFTLKASGSAHFPGDDDFGFYPWENPDAAESSVQWVSEEKVTLFTSDGLIQIGGNLVPRRVTSTDKKQGKARMFQRSQRFQESNYMDPNQSLCLGALFDIAATNVVAAEKATKEGLHEKLTMTVAVPLLWGVPPAGDSSPCGQEWRWDCGQGLLAMGLPKLTSLVKRSMH